VHLDHFEVLKQGKLETLQPAAPFEESASLDLKLVEVGLYDAAAGVGKVDGWNVVVSGAAKLVGKKVSVTVGRVLDGVAYAAVADDTVAPTPITFEAEAEKPTRVASAKKAEPEKPATSPRSRQKKAQVEEPAAEDTVAEPEVVEAVEVDESPAEPAPPKKKSRRGTRGGRGRKKTTTPTAKGDGEAEPETEAKAAAVLQEDGRARRPKIHVPPTGLAEEEQAGATETVEPAEPATTPDLPDSRSDPDAAMSDGEPAKKRTRRGTRGGRKRRKTPANGQATGAGAEDAAEAPAEAVAVVDAPEAEEYVPMSEWIEDFDRRR
jgi:predicted RNA-binding protein with TRAM domain